MVGAGHLHDHLVEGHHWQLQLLRHLRGMRRHAADWRAEQHEVLVLALIPRCRLATDRCLLEGGNLFDSRLHWCSFLRILHRGLISSDRVHHRVLRAHRCCCFHYCSLLLHELVVRALDISWKRVPGQAELSAQNTQLVVVRDLRELCLFLAVDWVKVSAEKLHIHVRIVRHSDYFLVPISERHHWAQLHHTRLELQRHSEAFSD